MIANHKDSGQKFESSATLTFKKNTNNKFIINEGINNET